jgi:hypothetical protein
MPASSNSYPTDFKEHPMNTIAKLLAPAALALVAFGAQAGEIAVGDIGSKPVMAGSAVAAPVTGPVGASGESVVGDLGAQKVSAQRVAKQPRDTMAQPVRSLYAIGA